MGNFIKGIILLAVGLIFIIIPISCVIGCVEDCNDDAKLKASNTQIHLIVDGFKYNDDFPEGKVVNYVSVGFKNTGKETVYRVSCKVHFYDNDDFLLGTLDFNYDSSSYEPVEYGQSTPRFSMHLTTHDGIHAYYFRVTDLKVNGYDKPSGYEG